MVTYILTIILDIAQKPNILPYEQYYRSTLTSLIFFIWGGRLCAHKSAKEGYVHITSRYFRIFANFLLKNCGLQRVTPGPGRRSEPSAVTMFELSSLIAQIFQFLYILCETFLIDYSSRNVPNKIVIIYFTEYFVYPVFFFNDLIGKSFTSLYFVGFFY